jgi:hypothetical protein
LSLEALEKNGYAGNEIVFKYNKTKALNYSNQLDKADVLITKLIDRLSEKD